MNIQNGDCLHVVLFGTFNESIYFLGDYKDKFDLIGFNANIIAHAPDGMAAFISQLQNKSYFIDPQIYAFQQPIKTIMRKDAKKNWVLKASIKKLAADYGSIINKKAGVESISAQDLNDDLIKEVSKQVLKFEFHKIKKASENLDVKEFLEFSGEELRPSFLIAPYFYLDADNLETQLEINKKFLFESKKISGEISANFKNKIFAEIVIDKEVLIDTEKMNNVINEYKRCNADGFLIWIDDFSEVIVKLDSLKKYLKFLKELANCRKPILSLHGSYLSVLLAGKEIQLLAGVGHGIEYGEYRPVIPVGGGVPLSKFYFPKFYERINYHPDASNILIEMDWILNKQNYFNNVCSCPTCREIISDNVEACFQKFGETKISEKNGQAYPTAKAMELSRRHYLNNKINEYTYCREHTVKDVLRNLQNNQQIAEKFKSVYTINHIEKWIKILESL